MKRYLLGAALLVAGATQANAALFVGVQVGVGAITQVASSTTGTLVFSSTAGTYSYSVSATGFPILSQPQLQTNSIDVQGGSGSDTLTIYVTQTDLNPIQGGLLSKFTYNPLDNVPTNSSILSTYVDSSNGLFGGTLLSTASFLDGTLQTSSDIEAVSVSSVFSETTKYVISLSNGSSVNDTINLSAVPEPASWAMMLGGFGFIGAALRSKRSKVRFA